MIFSGFMVKCLDVCSSIWFLLEQVFVVYEQYYTIYMDMIQNTTATEMKTLFFLVQPKYAHVQVPVSTFSSYFLIIFSLPASLIIIEIPPIFSEHTLLYETKPY